MLSLFKNLKVGTKLVAILVAPVVVLLILAAVGVSTRLAAADDANRVEQLASFAQANNDLIHEIELESVDSVVFMASDGTAGKAELDAQRAATDAALGGYNSSLAADDPAGGNEEIANAVDQATTRIDGLRTLRNSVDNLQTDPPTAADQFGNTIEDLIRVNVEVAKAVEEPELSRGLTSFVNLERVKAATTNEAALLSIVVQQGKYNRWVSPTETAPCGSDAGGAQVTAPSDDGDCQIYTDIVTAQEQIAQKNGVLQENATLEQKQIVRDAESGQEFSVLEAEIFQAGQDVENNVAAVVTPTAWLPVVSANLDSLKAAEDLLIVDVLDGATDLASSAQSEAFAFAIFTIGAVLIALIITTLVARATTRPLRELTTAAYSLSTERLPALVEQLRNPDQDSGESLAATLTPIEINQKDEIGQLADAFNSIQQVTIEVAEEQSQLLRKGIGDIFINLARRNQTLLDRQIEFIDQLEANEEDPDQLDNLFKLDHLATRMRRNAESLLVLAGAEPPRRRGRPVALADVVRVAIGEVEDFARIQLLSLDEATVGGNVAVDLAHLLSELMENATHFSPPDTMVEIVGHAAESGFILSVSDQGIGMSADQLAEANTQLARPPLVGLALSRSLGFIVIGRLATRFGIQVRLTSSPSGGVSALVTLPRDIVTIEGEVAPDAPAEAAVVEEAGDAPIVLDEAGSDDLLDELFEESPLAESEEFDRGLQSLVSDELPDAPVEPEVSTKALAEEPVVEDDLVVVVDEIVVVEDVVVEEPIALPDEPVVLPDEPIIEETPVVEAVPEPVSVVAEVAPAEVAEEAVPITAAGLVRRTPKERSATATGGGMAGAEPSVSAGQSQRSPEEIRKMLSRYRSGLNKGRDGDGEG